MRYFQPNQVERSAMYVSVYAFFVSVFSTLSMFLNMEYLRAKMSALVISIDLCLTTTSSYEKYRSKQLAI